LAIAFNNGDVVHQNDEENGCNVF